MQDSSDFDTLAMSRTFKVVDGKICPVDSKKPSEKYWHPQSLVGTLIDSKFQILNLLGEGGMGAVYRALHVNLNKQVALKTLRAEQLDDESWQRFQREALSIARLNHPNIVRLFDFGVGEEKFPYYTMELLAGESLADRLNRLNRLSVNEALAIFSAIAGAMAHAHRQGIVHRDIKPANIFIERQPAGGVPKVVDFGLAKLAETANRDTQSLTVAGIVFGSPLYMSPEQVTGKSTDHRTDIYSFGCSLFQCLAGVPPFNGTHAVEIMTKHQQEKPPSLVQAANGEETFTIELEAIVARLLAKDLERRYQSFEIVEQELARALTSSLNQQSNAFANAYRIDIDPVDTDYDGDEDGEQFAERSAEGGPDGQSVETDERPEQTSSREGDGGTEGDGEATPDFDQVHGLKKFAVISLSILLAVGACAYMILSSPSHRLPAAQTATSTKDAQQYYCTDGPDGGRTFTFPADIKDLGDLDFSSRPSVPARGSIFVPEGIRVGFTCREYCSDHPEAIGKFRPNDLNSLCVASGRGWKHEHFVQVGKLTGLRELDLIHSHIQSSDVEALVNLTNLIQLRVAQTAVSGDDLAKLPVLSHLRLLDAGDTLNMHLVMEKLEGSTSINVLSLKGCDVMDADLNLIATMPNLNFLSIDVNPVTTEGLKSLTRLKHLKTLGLVGIKLTPKILDFLPDFPDLQQLRIQVSDWSQADISRLQKIMAGRKLEIFGGPQAY